MRSQSHQLYLHLTRRAAGLLRAGLTAPPAHTSLFLASLGAALACKTHFTSKRLHYACEAAVDILQAWLACSLFGAWHQGATGASALRAVAAVVLGNGVLALACQARASLLPLRWQLGVSAATGAILLVHAPAMCASGLLQHGWATLCTAGRLLLPLISPAFADLLPPGGLAALAAPTPAPSAASAAQCMALQARSVALGCTALAWHLYHADRQRQRKAAAAPASGSGWEQLPACGRPPQPLVAPNA